MQHREQKIIVTALVAVASFGGLEALVYILNLNQVGIYLHTALWVYLALVATMAFLYDLHFKRPGSWSRARSRHGHVPQKLARAAKIIAAALWDRLEHLRKPSHLGHWLHYLLLPGIIFWATIGLLFVNFGYQGIQQTLVFLSSLALTVNYWNLKEIWYRRKEAVDRELFVRLAVVKIYASALVYGAGLALVRRYCLEPELLALGFFSLSFLLVYHALYQHRMVTGKNLLAALLIGAVLGGAGLLVLFYWGYNYFTGAILLAATYNLLWGVFHYHLDRSLTAAALLEILVITLMVAAMVSSVTNFRAKILDGCGYLSPSVGDSFLLP